MIALYTILGNLPRPLAVWDEQIYYDAAQNVLAGYWLLPRFTLTSHPLGSRTPFLHKPPLTYWIQAGSMAIGGETRTVARWPSVLATALAIGIAVLLAWRLSGAAAGCTVGAVAIPMNALHGTHAAFHVATDPFLLLFGTSAVYALVVAIDCGHTRWWLLAGVGYGLAIMSKGVAAAPFGLFVLPYLWRHRSRWAWRHFGAMVASGFAIVLPWLVSVALLAPSELYTQMFERQVVEHATDARFNDGDATFAWMGARFFQRGPAYFAPTGYFLPLAVLVTVAEYADSRRLTDLAMLCWPLAIGTFGLYVLVGNHLWYLLPVAVPVAVLVGSAIARTAMAFIEAVVTLLALRSTKNRYEQRP